MQTAFRREGPASAKVPREGPPFEASAGLCVLPFPPPRRPRAQHRSVVSSSRLAPFGEIMSGARGPCVQSFPVPGGERTWVFVHWDSGRERGSCGTEAVYLLPDRVIYTGTQHPSCCQDDPSPGDEFCRCTQNVSPGPPGLGCGAAVASVSRGVLGLPDPRSGGPPPAVAVVPGCCLGVGEA